MALPFKRRVYRQTDNLVGKAVGHRQPFFLCARHAPIHGHIADQRVEIAPTVDALVLHFPVQGITTQGVIIPHKHREIRAIPDDIVKSGQERYATHIGQFLPVHGRDLSSPCQSLSDMLELQKAKGCIEFAHLAIDPGRGDRDFIGKTKVFQIIDALLCLGVWTDDGAAFKGIEDFRGVKTEH